jgi:hypothetical protein
VTHSADLPSHGSVSTVGFTMHDACL